MKKWVKKSTQVQLTCCYLRFYITVITKFRSTQLCVQIEIPTILNVSSNTIKFPAYDFPISDPSLKILIACGRLNWIISIYNLILLKLRDEINWKEKFISKNCSIPHCYLFWVLTPPRTKQKWISEVQRQKKHL